MGYKLAEMGLNTNPSASSLQKAYEALKSEGLLFQNSNPEEAPKKKQSGSSVFGLGGGNTATDKSTKSTKTPEITDNMSPREILELFKQQTIAQGLSPDDVLRQQYNHR
jgi:hypothetical protein